MLTTATQHASWLAPVGIYVSREFAFYENCRPLTVDPQAAGARQGVWKGASRHETSPDWWKNVRSRPGPTAQAQHHFVYATLGEGAQRERTRPEVEPFGRQPFGVQDR